MSNENIVYTTIEKGDITSDSRNIFEKIYDTNFWSLKPYADEVKNSLVKGFADTKQYWIEVGNEFSPPPGTNSKDLLNQALDLKLSFTHVPYFPAFHRPGWLLKYIVGPYNEEWAESIFNDVWAGITVGLTLIPQGLSYAALANLPPICGLYAAVLPSACYTFFGSSMQLAVGPVAVVSLLTGQIVIQFVPNYATDTASAVNCGAQVALAVGSVLAVLSILNLGNLIRYISYPVMSGFTSGAACVIGINQLKNGFGFTYSSVPQQGQTGFDYNYQVMHWFRVHWNERWYFTENNLQPKVTNKITKKTTGTSKYQQNRLYNGEPYRNVYAQQILFGVYFPLLLIALLKWGFPETPERKKSIVYKLWTIFAALAPFISIIIATHECYVIKKNDGFDDYLDFKNKKVSAFKHPHSNYYAYSLGRVGPVQPGLGFLRTPKMQFNFGDVLKASIPVALIAFMESYSVSRRIAANRGELHLLNASQELWANGVANFLASVSSAYPVCGSFSRSALNHACGAKTPLSKVTTMIVIIVALKSLTGLFEYIPQAVLSAIIWAAIWSLVSWSDLVIAWKNNKRDFFTMLFTWIIVLTFNTGVGLAAGICVSGAWFVLDLIITPNNFPKSIKSAKNNNGIEELKLYSDNVTFLNSDLIKDHIIKLTNVNPFTKNATLSFQDKVLLKVSQVFDKITFFKNAEYAIEAPIAIAIDFSNIKYVDLTGNLISICLNKVEPSQINTCFILLILLIKNNSNSKTYMVLIGLIHISELFSDLHKINIKLVLFNVSDLVATSLNKFGITNDSSSFNVNLDEYLNSASNVNKSDVKDITVAITFNDTLKYYNESKDKEIVVSDGSYDN